MYHPGFFYNRVVHKNPYLNTNCLLKTLFLRIEFYFLCSYKNIKPECRFLNKIYFSYKRLI